MKIGFVAEPYEETHASGMGYVVLELMRNLPKEGMQHEFVFYSSRPIDRTSVPGPFEQVIIPRGFLGKLWYFWRLSDKPDALVYMVPMMPLITRGILSVPMCQEVVSQKIRPSGVRDRVFSLVRDQILMRLCFARARHVIAASQATKDDLVKFYKLPAEKISVIYDGFQSLERFSADAEPVDNNLQPYFFFAGKVKYRKNVHGIVSAFTAFKERMRNPCTLVLAGDYGGPYYDRIMTEVREHNCERDVHFVGYATGPQMYAYYTGALACLFPSLNEGFGMPIIEAMSLGTPVITSNISSMAEVAGDAGLLVDPKDPASISAAMERIYRNEELRMQLIAKGKARSAQFSWSKAAREYIEVLEKL
jgi:glycosyltransferase involved in cell wall biosynthesis